MTAGRDDEGMWGHRRDDRVVAGLSDGDVDGLSDVVASLRALAEVPPPAASPALAAVLRDGLPSHRLDVAVPVAAPVAASWRTRLGAVAATGVAVKLALGAGVAAAAVGGLSTAGALPGPVDRAVDGLVAAVTAPFTDPAPAERMPVDVPDLPVPPQRGDDDVPTDRPIAPAPVLPPPAAPPAQPPADAGRGAAQPGVGQPDAAQPDRGPAPDDRRPEQAPAAEPAPARPAPPVADAPAPAAEADEAERAPDDAGAPAEPGTASSPDATAAVTAPASALSPTRP